MPYRIVELELSQPLSAFTLDAQQDGYALLARWHGRPIGYHQEPVPPATPFDGAALGAIVDEHFALAVLGAKTEDALEARCAHAQPVDAPPLSIAICTKDRAARLERLLRSLVPLRETSRFRSLEIIVVDNASVDDATRTVAASFDDVRYVREPRTGLDFARNAALEAATGELLAYLDDDVVVDRGWLDGLYRVWRDCPDAGGYTGLVLPYRLDTKAQVEFERAGGFGRGFARIHHHAAKLANPLHPVGAGVVGAGANMCFERALLRSLGGFDEALDTGAPLPGGGDLDIFYRVLRSGRAIVYEPRYAVFHEHRETLAQLRRQYWTWGLGFMAFLVKSRRTDPALRERHAAMVRWWFGYQLDAVYQALRRRHLNRLRFALAELAGGVQGLCGEYDRSLARSRRIREQTAA
jgi:glycosyltransferase involved in cell wall biosynthesis